MYLIQQVTSDSLQQQTFVLPDGSSVLMQFYFVPMQYSWFITELVYQDFILNGLRIVVSPNMLLQYRNQIPFGLACYTTLNREPSLQQDFSSGAFQLYFLDSTEVQTVTQLLTGGVSGA